MKSDRHAARMADFCASVGRADSAGGAETGGGGVVSRAAVDFLLGFAAVGLRSDGADGACAAGDAAAGFVDAASSAAAGAEGAGACAAGTGAAAGAAIALTALLQAGDNFA